MKRFFCSLFLSVMLIPTLLSSQTVTGKLVDQNGNGLSGLQLKLYISPKTYDATSSNDGSFTFNNITDVKNDDELPTGYSVSNNYPNPFNPKTRIGVTLPNGGNVKVNIYNLLGQRVSDEIERYFSAGTNFIDVELNGLPNGFYLARITLDEKYSVTKKLILLYGSQHLSSTKTASFSKLNKSTFTNYSPLITNLDSIVVTGFSISRKVFKNLPSMTGYSLDLGNLVTDVSKGNIEIGSFVNVSTTQMGTAGGTIKVSKPGAPVHGMELTIPPNSFSTTKTFQISYAEIKSHQFGQYFNPISPLISVSYEGGYSSDGMSVKIPINLPAGHFAMGFLYDDKTGTLEGMPIESLDNNFITVDTRVFTAASTQLKKKNGTNDISTGNMIVSSISESILNGQTIISSGFTPGVDDWEFVNYGSYIAPGGHCAGQSLTAMWYYFEKKLQGAASLFHLYDQVNTKTDPALLWHDNPYGYRFASTIQKDFDWDGWVTHMNFRSVFPTLVWKAFAASMLLTGEPQSVLIRNSLGKGGHAMIVYKINFAEGKLYIADPNYPNNIDPATKTESIRTIDYVNGKFNSYFTGLTAGANSTEMDQISYFGKTAYIDWRQVGKRWVEFENKTIGNDRFPKYNLKIRNDGDKELTDQFSTDKDTLEIYCKSTDCVQWLKGTDHYQDMDVYDEQGKFIATANTNGITVVGLKRGSNKLGIFVKGAINKSVTNYVDFKWITVDYQPFGCAGVSSVSYAGKTYNTVQIGSQCWLKENLDVGTMVGRYGRQTDNGVIEKYCWDNNPTNCNTFGGLYQWSEAMQYVTTETAQGICPTGWHIPTLADWNALFVAVGNDGNALKAVGQGYGDGVGTNTSGFSALLAGHINIDGTNGGLYDYAWFWTSRYSVYDNKAFQVSLGGRGSGTSGNWANLQYGFSIRCIKD